MQAFEYLRILPDFQTLLGIILNSELCRLFRARNKRHTFAVHTLLRWYREGADIDAKLPVLATYLGHQSLAGTQHYLHLTAELFPEIEARVNAAFGDVIPRRTKL
jgi:integrase